MDASSLSPDGPLTVHLSLTINPEQARRLRERARREGTSKSEIGRLAFAAYLSNGDDAEGPTSASSELPARVPPG